MRIAVILASSQADKNEFIYNAVCRYAKDAQVVDLGCFPGESEEYSYTEISVLIGLLLNGGAADFVVTGCSSGQGMMLACNSMPGVLCGYAPTPMDAYLFAQINDGNAISLPLGEGYTWAGEENAERTIEKLFSEPFGQGYPKTESERKLRDTRTLKAIRAGSQISMIDLLEKLDKTFLNKVLSRKNVIRFIEENGKDEAAAKWLKERIL